MSRLTWRTLMRLPYLSGALLAFVLLFLAPIKFGLTQTDAVQPHVPLPGGVWEWVLLSYPSSFLFYGILAIGLCAVAAALLWRPVALPRSAYVAGAGWLLFMCAILAADRRVPAEWIDHEARTLFLLYGVWAICAWFYLSNNPTRPVAAQVLVTAGWFVVIEAVRQYMGGLDDMRRYAAEQAGFTSFAAYTNHLLQTSSDPRTVLYVKKLISMRVSGTFVNPNALGGFLILLIPMALAVARSAEMRLGRWVAWCVLAGSSSALMLSRSKSSIVLAAAALGALLLLALRARRVTGRAWAAGTMLAGTLAIVMLMWGYGGGLSERLQATGGARLEYWRAAARMVARQPWLGWGSGGFARGYGSYRRPGAEDTRLAHNLVLNVWTDYGIAGVAGVSVALGMPLLIGWRRALRAGGAGFDWLQAGALVAVSGCLLHCLVDFDFHIPGIMIPALWLLACAASDG